MLISRPAGLVELVCDGASVDDDATGPIVAAIEAQLRGSRRRDSHTVMRYGSARRQAMPSSVVDELRVSGA